MQALTPCAEVGHQLAPRGLAYDEVAAQSSQTDVSDPWVLPFNHTQSPQARGRLGVAHVNHAGFQLEQDLSIQLHLQCSHLLPLVEAGGHQALPPVPNDAHKLAEVVKVGAQVCAGCPPMLPLEFCKHQAWPPCSPAGLQHSCRPRSCAHKTLPAQELVDLTVQAIHLLLEGEACTPIGVGKAAWPGQAVMCSTGLYFAELPLTRKCACQLCCPPRLLLLQVCLACCGRASLPGLSPFIFGGWFCFWS
mmetsp:Transcript_15369/g.41586  ORF Transcript_15369/g.41586 Transcript_15369/m.41586 type:complete len:248 (+) Transcript_15369:928-1671(+)